MDDIFDDISSDDLVIILPGYETLPANVKEALDANLATEKKISTIGQVALRFIDENDREKGVWAKQVPMAQEALKFFKDKVEEWKEKGIVEPLNDLANNNVGHFNTNAFPIYSGKLRIVHNFKPLNALLQDDTADVPGISEAFNAISAANPVIFSKIDLHSAYLQIPLRPEDRSLTGFMCDNVRYRFVTAPLGIKTIPSIFQRDLRALLQREGCLDFCRNHVDDICIYSASVKEHVEHVIKVLNALTKVNLTVNADKCRFFATRLPMLGYVLQVGRHSAKLPETL